MTQGGYVKDVSGFIALEGAAEPPLERQQGYLTRNEDFFICHAGPTPRIDVSTWRLDLRGDALARPLTLAYDDLRAMPQATLPAYLECAGNQRSFYETILGRPLDLRPDVAVTRWGLGGVGMAEWRGVPLRHVLERAGIGDDARHVMPVGLDIGNEEDEDGIRVPLPVEKAMDPDTLIALEMNGEPLPPDHGFPARFVVPGWVGTYSIKWLGRIEVTTARPLVPRNTRMYVMIGRDWPAGDYAPAHGAPVTKQPVRSSLALAWPAQLPPGRNRLRGYARGNDHPIASVAWSADRGATWRGAELLSPARRWAWVEFAFDWEAEPGEHVLMTRATDESGAAQPMTIPFNHGGYLFNMVHPHPVVVAG